MIRDEGWLELTEVVPTKPNGWTDVNRSILSPEVLKNAETAIHIFCSRDDGDDHATIIPLTSFVVQPCPILRKARNCEENKDDEEDNGVDAEGQESPSCLLRLHPVMYFFLHHASSVATSEKIPGGEQPNESQSDSGFQYSPRVQIAPLPMLEFQSIVQAANEQQRPQNERKYSWKSRQVIVEKLKRDSHIHVSCVYVEDDNPWPIPRESSDDKRKSNSGKDRRVTAEHAIGIALEGRIVQAGSVVLLSTIYGYVIASVTDIIDQDGKRLKESNSSRNAYRLSDDVLTDYHCHIQGPPILNNESNRNDREVNNDLPMVWERNVAGYEGLLEEIMNVFRVHGDASAASGVVLTGCAGVGKSRLASCVAHYFSDNHVNHQKDTHEPDLPSATKTSDSSANRDSLKNQNNVYYSSVQDLIFQASAETNLLENVLVPKLRRCKLWIVDDLNLLETPEGCGDEVKNDAEIMMVQNALVEAIDRFHHSSCILGLAQSAANLPLELTKSGRFEKTFQMLQPTQLQRIEIWKRILADGNGGESMQNADKASAGNNDWILALASSTAGCVPRDLLRIYRDAEMKLHARQCRLDDDCDSVPELEWEDLREAMKSAIPSQLSELDVIKPTVFDGNLSWKEIHLRSWQDFAGYPLLKKSVYRQVIVPWRFFLQSVDESLTGEIKKNEKSWLEPPPGVLFHGISGTGKTVAAKCLAVSLGLPIIQVRATDLLDKWLGGSESLLRSLFTRARAVSPCVLFLDEIDAIACNREEDDNSDVSSRILSTLLNEMDGVSSAIQKSRVLVIACTNRIRSIDSALLRPGRLQEHFHMGNPDVSDVEEILKLRMGKIPMAKCLNLKHLALAMFESGATGADIGGLCREATFIAMRRVDLRNDGEVAVSREDFISALAERFGT